MFNVRIIAFSDWRVQSIDILFQIIKEIDNVDAIVYAGDDLNRFDYFLFLKKIKQNLQRNSDDKSYIGMVDEKILCFVFPHRTNNILDEDLKELAIFKINTRKCDIKPEIFKIFTGSKLNPGGGQYEAIEYKLKEGIESGRVIEIEEKIIIIFKVDTNNKLIPIIDYHNIFQELSKRCNIPILGVIGNDDLEECSKALTGPNVFNVHKNPINLDEHDFIGIQGVICDDDSFKIWQKNRERRDLSHAIHGSCIGYVAISESNAKKHLENQLKKVNRNPIIISHTPPYGVLDISRRYGIRHIGSKELRNFILKNEVPLVICGHVHGYGGYTEKIEKSIIVNVSSHDKHNSEGNIAIIDCGMTIKVKWIKISDYGNSIRKIKDIGIYRETLLTTNGIISLNDLVNCSDELLKGLRTRRLTKMELKNIFSIAENEEEYLILTLFLKNNISIKELKRLYKKNINFDNKIIHFRKSGRNNLEERKIFIGNETSQQLKRYISVRPYIKDNPIFFSSFEDETVFKRLYEKFENLNHGTVEPKGGIRKTGKELVAKANAYQKDEIIIYKKIDISDNIIFVDIETSPVGIESSFPDLGNFYIYLIGVYHKENGYQYFITKRQQPDEKQILKDFINYIKSQKNKKITLCAYNGLNFDFKYLEEKIKMNSLDVKTFKQIKKLDLLKVCRNNLYTPKGFSLPVVASYFGYAFKNPEKNGYHMGIEYQGYILGTCEEPNWENIIENNKDDVLAMKHIVENISK